MKGFGLTFLSHLGMAASGAAMGLAFPPYNFFPLAWLALVPPLLFATSDKPRWLLTGGTTFGAAWATVMLDWLVNIFGWHAIGLWILVGLFCALTFGLITYVRYVWGFTAAVSLAPLIWVGLEYYRSEVWALRFPWLALGYSQYKDLLFLQSASVVGLYGLSLVMVAFASAVVFAIRGRSRMPLFGIGAVITLMHLAPLFQTPEPDAGTLKIAGIQLECPSLAGLRAGLERLSCEHPDAAVFVLPEYCLDVTKSTQGLDVVREFAKDRWVIVGAKVPAPNGSFYNVVIALEPGGNQVFQQVKSVPVPLMRDGLPAESRQLLHLPQGRIGVGLCYDQDFTFIANDLVAQGAEFFLFPTGDLSSWGDKQRVQHATLATMRAIEHRRWVMRVASSGVSRVVDPYGRTVAEQGTDAPGGPIAARIAMRSERTLFARFGWLLPHGCLWGSALALVAAVLRRLILKMSHRRHTLLWRFAKNPITTAMGEQRTTRDFLAQR